MCVSIMHIYSLPYLIYIIHLCHNNVRLVYFAQQHLRILPSKTCGNGLRPLDVERCRIFFYDSVKDILFCKFITGRLREPITFKLESYNFLSQVLNSGMLNISTKLRIPRLLQNLESKRKSIPVCTRISNVMFILIKLGNHAIGVF